MTSKLIQFRNIEAELARLQEHLAHLDGETQVERDIKAKIDAILHDAGKDESFLADIYNIKAGKVQAKTEKKTRSPRAVKKYINPHTNEVIETKGGNHAQLKIWKQEHGSDEVESWLAQAS